MKYLSIKSMAWITAMVSTSISAQSTVPDETIDITDQFTVTKVKYQDDNQDELSDKSFSGTYHLNIAASGSVPIMSSDNDYTYANKGCFYANVVGLFDVNIQLPGGHRINGIRYFYDDNSASSNSQVTLYRINQNTGTYSSLQSVTSSGSAGVYTSHYENISTPHFIDNANYAYVLRFQPGSPGIDQIMCGARLNMTATP
ncbi:hypothetical protein [Marinicella gelatinilytica]|uniref:hypothetical protein n=1 Tax=Marinicella gelatinilytica TaxID=2996017 RepID=UPI002261014B|nr:hypothetical protein [Marinicella gelatinilytica]MCX7545296.1 hypothetical protein [Marinicella gelatinilytica]